MSETGSELIEQDQEVKLNLPALPDKQTEALMVMIQGATANPQINTDVIKELWEMQK